ncbi:hypothetical protein CBR_g26336 [Chara braunii]|uniref:DM2 domain-containing protein n=1 Tax=Chara braunii TaxID=69332 RepID=A0A388L7M9_CHABU|nr:hypothetical protein CBR_g26336 [Chara braunii]|eukprot:GBG78306.1 hypothetical protein CBR_g26336 [Chara braunii]
MLNYGVGLRLALVCGGKGRLVEELPTSLFFLPALRLPSAPPLRNFLQTVCCASSHRPVSLNRLLRLKALLAKTDLSTTTERSLRKQLEEELGADLSEKKLFIRSHLEAYLNQGATAEDGEEEGDDDAGENGADDNGEDPDGEVEDEEEDEEEEEVDNKKPKPKKGKVEVGQKRKAGGLSKGHKLSEGLASVLGVDELPRTQVVKMLWEYIRKHNLQDPQNKKNIIFDEKLRSIFGTATTDMFKINKLLSNHILPSENGASNGQPRPKKPKTEGKDKHEKGGGGKVSGFSKPLPISQSLIDFLGTGVKQLARSQVVKEMWQYIKTNNLQDPNDKRKILCDQKLKRLLKCDSFNGFGMTKLLSPHFLKSRLWMGETDFQFHKFLDQQASHLLVRSGREEEWVGGWVVDPENRLFYRRRYSRRSSELNCKFGKE